MEGWHSSSWDALPNYAHEFCVGEPLYFALLSDVRGALSTSAIQPMTTGARGNKNFLPFLIL
jgi:hypothetical protein